MDTRAQQDAAVDAFFDALSSTSQPADCLRLASHACRHPWWNSFAAQAVSLRVQQLQAQTHRPQQGPVGALHPQWQHPHASQPWPPTTHLPTAATATQGPVGALHPQWQQPHTSQPWPPTPPLPTQPPPQWLQPSAPAAPLWSQRAPARPFGFGPPVADKFPDDPFFRTQSVASAILRAREQGAALRSFDELYSFVGKHAPALTAGTRALEVLKRCENSLLNSRASSSSSISSSSPVQ